MDLLVKGEGGLLLLPHLHSSSEEPLGPIVAARDKRMLLLPLRKAGVKERAVGRMRGPAPSPGRLKGGNGCVSPRLGLLSRQAGAGSLGPSTGSEEGGIETDEERTAQGSSDRSRAHSGWWKAGSDLGGPRFSFHITRASKAISRLVGRAGFWMAAPLLDFWGEGGRKRGKGERTFSGVK